MCIRDSATGLGIAEVPDPYYGDADGFERVLDICEVACAALLAHIQAKHALR